MSRRDIHSSRARVSRGFSLIELLVVIGIVAVLMAILFTVFHSALKFVWSLKG